MHQWQLYSRGPLEAGWFTAVTILAGASAWSAGRRAAGRPGGPLDAALTGVVAALAASVMLALVFDARYRHFPVAAFLAPALGALWPVRATGPWPGRYRVLAWVLIAGVPVVLWQETPGNAQAVGWCVVAGLLALGLLRSRGQDPAGASGPNRPASASASSASTVAGAPKRTL